MPEEKLKKLAKALGQLPGALLGKDPPIEVRLYNDSAGDQLDYYGEVAIHFHGRCAPLCSRSPKKTFSDLYRDLQLSSRFVSERNLVNQAVAIRIKAMADLYFSSEAYDDYGRTSCLY